jgi:type II secretory pathway pseudopilin PulG
LELVVVVAVLVVLASFLIPKVERVRDDAEATAAQATLHTAREAFVGSPTGPGYIADMKFVPGFNPAAIQIRDLLEPSRYPDAATYDPIAQRGWRGPYLQNVQPVRNTNPARQGFFPSADERRDSGDATFLDRHFFETATSSFYGEPGDRAAADPWGNPLVVQVPPVSEFTVPSVEKRFRYARIVSAGADGVLDTPRDRLAGLLPDGTSAARGDDIVIFLNRADVYEPEEP